MRLLIKNNNTAIFTALIGLQFCFPLFRENISSIFIILLLLAALLFGKPLATLAHNRQLFFLSIPFFAIVLRGSAGTFPESLAPAQHALFFLVFPIVFTLLPSAAFSREKVNLYMHIFRNCCALVAIGYILLFLYYYDYRDFFVYQYNVPHFRDFVYNETPFFKIHPTYYSTMLLPCTAFSMGRLAANWRKNFYEVLYLAIFVGITFLLLSKLNIILLLALLAHGILFRSGLKVWGKIALLLAGLFVCAGVLVKFPGVQNRFTEMIDSIGRPPRGLAHDSTNIRQAIISCSTELTQQNYLTGIGFGNISDAFRTCFASHYESDFFVGKSYMSHNYFFYMIIGGGILSFLAFGYFVLMVLRRAGSKKKYLLWVTVISVLLVCFTEDYFYRHFGLYFFCLMFCTLYREENMVSNLPQEVV